MKPMHYLRTHYEPRKHDPRVSVPRSETIAALGRFCGGLLAILMLYALIVVAMAM